MTPSVKFPLRRFRVEDESMRPTLEPGDYVLVNAWAYTFRRPAKGDLVVVRDPEESNRYLIKRILEVTDGSRVRVQGDNEAHSRDSRSFGPIATYRIVGKVWIRLKR